MKILLTGANGYIGTRLLPRLVDDGHEIYALVRSRSRIEIPEKFQSQLHVIEADLLNPSSLLKIPADIDAAYYLVHSMSYSQKFSELEAASAKNFVSRLENTTSETNHLLERSLKRSSSFPSFNLEKKGRRNPPRWEKFL